MQHGQVVTAPLEEISDSSEVVAETTILYSTEISRS